MNEQNCTQGHPPQAIGHDSRVANTGGKKQKNYLTLLGLPQALDESHRLALESAGHPAPRARVHELHELLRVFGITQQKMVQDPLPGQNARRRKTLLNVNT